MILGDSISAGYGIKESQNWVSLLENSINSNGTKLRIINSSVSGDTTIGGLSRITSDLEKHTPDFVLIELGGNDGMRGYPIEEIKNNLKIGNATNLPWEDNYFDFVYSLNSLHCLPARDLYKSLIEMERVGKNDKYLCVESFRNEEEKANLLYWQVTCESFHNKDSWHWWFELTGYKGDYSFIYFE